MPFKVGNDNKVIGGKVIGRHPQNFNKLSNNKTVLRAKFVSRKVKNKTVKKITWKLNNKTTTATLNNKDCNPTNNKTTKKPAVKKPTSKKPVTNPTQSNNPTNPVVNPPVNNTPANPVNPPVTPPATPLVNPVVKISNPTITLNNSTLTLNKGTWSGDNLNYEIKWYRCDSQDTCILVNNSTESYEITEDDDNNYIKALVITSNSVNTIEAYSNNFNVIGLPANTILPELSGLAETGSTLYTTNGTWQNSPSSYTYQWQKCEYIVSIPENPPTEPFICEDINGATNDNFEVPTINTSQYLGRMLRVKITAINYRGSTSVYSNLSDEIVPGLFTP